MIYHLNKKIFDEKTNSNIIVSSLKMVKLFVLEYVCISFSLQYCLPKLLDSEILQMLETITLGSKFI